MRSAALGIALGSLSALGCGSDSAGDATTVRVDSAGTAVFTYQGPDRPLAISYLRDTQIGGEPSGPASFYQVDASRLAVDPRGAIVVVDAANSRVGVFEPTGEVVASFGREGDGPGEFGYAAAVATLEDGTIVVHDYRKRALQYFTPEGAFLRQDPLSIPFSGMGMGGTRTGLVLLSRNAPRNGGGFVHRLLQLSPEDTVQLGDSVTSMAVNVFYKSCGVGMTLPPLFAAPLVWGSNRDRTAVVAGPEYRVEVYSGAALVLVVQRSLSPEPVTMDVIDRVLGDGEAWTIGVRGRTCVVPPTEVIEQRGYAPLLPLIESVAVEPSGQLWVKRRAIGSETRWIDLFTSGGSYIGTAPGDGPFPVLFLPDGRLLTIESDSLDIQRVVVYQASVEVE